MSFSITTIMICRITLNLRTTAYGTAAYDEQTTGSLQLTEMPRRSRYRSGAQRSSLPFSTASLTSTLRIGVQVQTQTKIERLSGYGSSNGSTRPHRSRVVRYNDTDDGESQVGLGDAGAAPGLSTRYSNSPSFASGSGWRISEPPSFASREVREAGYGSLPESPVSPSQRVTTYAFASIGESSPRDESFHHLRSASSTSMYGPSHMDWRRKSDTTWTM